MTPFRFRFVGSEQLPKGLTETDAEQFFKLLPEDVEALRARFPSSDQHVQQFGQALQLVFLRATGRSLDGVAAVPKALAMAIGASLAIRPPNIATLKSIYKSRTASYEHRAWARKHCEFRQLDDSLRVEFTSAIQGLANTAASLDEVVVQASYWLYERKILLPGDRALRDSARVAFAGVEAHALQTIKAAVSADALRKLISTVFEKKDENLTVLEWLKTPTARHSPSTIDASIDKIKFLRGLGVAEWDLDKVSMARQRAYAQALSSRPPSETKKRTPDTQALEVVFFLRITLYELTDSTLYMADRRISDFYRRASKKTEARQATSAAQYREQLVEVKQIIRAPDRTPEEKLSTIDALIDDDVLLPKNSHAATVRKTLIDEPAGIRSLLHALRDLPIQGQPGDRLVAQISELRALHDAKMTELPEGFDTKLVDPSWGADVADADRKRAMRAFEAATLTAVRNGLRSAKLWVDHSFRFKDRELMLIPAEDWKAKHASYSAMINLPESPDEFLEKTLASVQVGLQAMAEAIEAGKLPTHPDGTPKLEPFSAKIDAPGAQRVRDAFSEAMGPVQLPTLLLQADAAINFSAAILGRKATSVEELLGVYGGLVAHGTDLDAKGVASMIPQINASRISTAMRMLEGADRLRRANERVVEYQGSFAIAGLWGSGQRASSDMMAMDASQHLFNARIDPRRRGFAMGIYTHVLDRYGIANDEPIVLMERQSGMAVQGVEKHNMSAKDRVRVSLLAVDTHGFTYPAMTLAKGLGFDLCPRLKAISDRKLFVPAGSKVPSALERVVHTNISLKAIRKGWDPLRRLLASIRTERINPELAIRRLGSTAQGDPLYRAADELGRLLRTIFLCDYFTNVEFRRELHTLLNRGEAVHVLQRAIYFGRIRHDRGRRPDELIAISGAHSLLTNIVIAWNTCQMQSIRDRWEKNSVPMDDDLIRGAGPIGFSHINFRGIFDFSVARYAEQLLEAGAHSSGKAASTRR